MPVLARSGASMTRIPSSAYAPVNETNPLGLAGFICSLIGLVSVGILSPVGLILSLVALGRQPKGFAIAGVILGLLGTCGGLLLVVFALTFGVAVLLAAVGIFMFSQSERIELTADMAKIAAKAQHYKEQNRGIAPAGLEILNLDQPALTDPWNNRYTYVLTTENPGYNIISNGEDGKSGTADDISLRTLDQYWKGAMKDFKRQMKEMEEWDSPSDQAGASSSAPSTGPSTQPAEPAEGDG